MLVLVVLLVPAVVAAQEASAAAAPVAGGNGIKVGEGRLHPFFDLELRFNSAAVSTRGDLVPEFLMHFRPGLRLEVPGRVVALNLSGNVDFVWYTALLTDTSSRASHLEGALDLDAAFNASGPVEFRIHDHLQRSDRTTNPALGVGVLSLYNQASVALPIHPGGGALEITPGASFTFEFFEPLIATIPGNAVEVTNPAAFNYTSFGFSLNGRYKFLPKTALVLDASFQLPQFSSGSAMLLNATAGISGLISPRVALVAKAGWAHNFTETTAQTVVGHVELNYIASQTASVKVGYLRNLNPIAIYSVYGDDRGYLDGRALFGGRFTLRGYAAFDYLTYYQAGRNPDTNFTLDVGPQYQFTPWLVGAGGYVLILHTSGVSTAGSYTRHEGYLRLTLQY